MLTIKSLRHLKITKVKPWSIYFDYEGKHYLIHGKSELGEGSWQELYERELDENGKYNLIKLGCCNYATDSVASDYIKAQNGKTTVYSQVDKAYFAYMLTKRGFANGVMEEKVLAVAERVAKINGEIEEHEKAISKLKEQRRAVESLTEAKVVYQNES